MIGLNSLKLITASIKFTEDKCILQIINPISNKQFEINLNLKEQDLNSRFTTLENCLVEQNNKIDDLESFIAEQEEKITNLETLLKEQKEKNVNIEAFKKEQNNKIISLEKRIKQLEIIVNAYKQKIEEKEKKGNHCLMILKY